MKVKFGICLPIYGGWIRNVPYEESEISYEYTKKVALQAEKLGLDSIWISDHLINTRKGEKAKSLETWTTLTAIATTTEKINLFTTSLCQAFRYPAVLAKMCTTLSDISKSRFNLSLGAGWFKREFEAYGIPWHEHDDRIDRGREQIEIIKKFWSEPNISYKGRFYEIVEGVMEPKPENMPDVWWAGESEKSRTLTADLADGWVMYSSDIQMLKEKMEDMKNRIYERGREPIQYAMPCITFIDRKDEKVLNKLNALVGGNEEITSSIKKSGLVGSPETVIDKVKKLDEVGLDHIMFQISPALELLNIIGEEILPCL